MIGLRSDEEEEERRVESASAMGREFRSAEPGSDQDEQYFESASVEAVGSIVMAVVVCRLDGKNQSQDGGEAGCSLSSRNGRCV